MKYEESSTVELKRDIGTQFAKEVIAFLNSNNGSIYLGVDDNGVVQHIENKDEFQLKVSNIINTTIYPNPRSFIEIKYNKDDVLEVRITKGNQRPYYLLDKGPIPSGTFIRYGNGKRQATYDEILTMIMDSKDFSFENDVSEEQNLHFTTLKMYFDKAGEDFGPHKYKTLRFINKNKKFTNLALLFSDENPIEIKFAKYSNNMDFEFKREYRGSLISIADRVLIQADDFNSLKAIIPNREARRIETLSYPGKSLREAILNAVCHADYSEPSNIKIEFFDHEVKISSPGSIYRATLEDVLDGKQTFRNPGIVKIFMRLNYIENYGTGLKRINEAYKDFKVTPNFFVTNDYFRVTLPNINYEYKTKTNLQSNRHDDSKLKIKRAIKKEKKKSTEELLIELIKTNPNITRTDMAIKLGKSRATIRRWLIQSKKIKYIGSSKSGYWEIVD